MHPHHPTKMHAASRNVDRETPPIIKEWSPDDQVVRTMASGVAFDHVLIVADNLERSIGFYELLGFRHVETIQRPEDRVAVMMLGETKLELMCLPEGRETRRPARRPTDIGFRHLGVQGRRHRRGVPEAQRQDPFRVAAHTHSGEGWAHDGVLLRPRRGRASLRS